ncbi:arsenite efflux transporter metallochaperone ArsD [Cryobacterium sp. HLT2-28]|uniref:arsenite efflux transporter metallochaperone ArsD n=1 Tax=Cryobacterium sp. HLT2-28 TaxID=1259146 RepID=UPI00106AD3C3|nr:arsenite efflux transporter metallochaperone ArsD [Cryobacterium sp. HLT2-28]TFB91409.1 arsenite efflux transporter metallochaperone ArsD [Cryobacterium sp. HLT2-28]
MANIQIFEPGLCCGTGICGVDVDEALVTVSADLDWTRSQGGQVTRFNLAQEPLAFVEDEIAHAFLLTAGEEGLPLTVVDGATVLTGRYPSRAELGKWAGIQTHESAVQPEGSPRLLAMAAPAAALEAEAGCCGGTGGCC